MHSKVGSKIFDSIFECIVSFVLIFIRRLSQSTIFTSFLPGSRTPARWEKAENGMNHHAKIGSLSMPILVVDFVVRSQILTERRKSHEQSDLRHYDVIRCFRCGVQPESCK